MVNKRYFDYKDDFIQQRIIDILRFRDNSEQVLQNTELFSSLWGNVSFSILVLVFAAVRDLIHQQELVCFRFQNVAKTILMNFLLVILLTGLFVHVFKRQNILLEIKSKISILSIHGYQVLFLLVLSPILALPFFLSKIGFAILSYIATSKSLGILYKPHIKRLPVDKQKKLQGLLLAAQGVYILLIWLLI